MLQNRCTRGTDHSMNYVKQGEKQQWRQSMNIYRFSFTVDDEIKAESLTEAWDIVKQSITAGYYGPTRENLEFDRELPKEGEAVASES